MAKNYIQDGVVLDDKLTGTITPGTPAMRNDLFGVYLDGGVDGDTVAFQTEGVFPVAKLAGQAQAFGVQLYWDAGNSHLTTVASTHKKAGKVAKAALSADTSVHVKLNA